MHTFSVILLLAVVTTAHAQDSVDDFVDKFFDRTLQASIDDVRGRTADSWLDSSSLGKSGSLTSSGKLGPRAVLPSNGRRRPQVRMGATAPILHAGGNDTGLSFDSLGSCSRRSVARAGPLVILSPWLCPDRIVRGTSASAATSGFSASFRKAGDTNEVVKTVNGIKHKRLGNSDIFVSEVGLGTQRWGGTDFNSPDESLCHRLLDIAVENGINLVDTAEQYPIPDGPANPEGLTEQIIGNWLRQDKSRREKLVIATKITGGPNVTPKNIVKDLEESLKRLGTDYVDIYLLHWPARYTPQANWGQSLEYDWNYGKRAVPRATSFRGIVEAMGTLLKQGKIRGYGACNDNAVGLLGMAAAARELGVPGPCVMENDYSILNRRIEENGLSEASSPALTNTGFFAYNVLASGMLTGKYADVPAAVDDPDEKRAQKNIMSPRGRMDERGWGLTLIRYRTEAARAAQAQYAKLAKSAGMSTTELALRFGAGRSAVTSCLVGHTSVAQLEECIAAFRQPPLPAQLQWEIDRVHLQNRLPLFANARTGDDWYNQGEIGERIP